MSKAGYYCPSCKKCLSRNILICPSFCPYCGKRIVPDYIPDKTVTLNITKVSKHKSKIDFEETEMEE